MSGKTLEQRRKEGRLQDIFSSVEATLDIYPKGEADGRYVHGRRLANWGSQGEGRFTRAKMHIEQMQINNTTFKRFRFGEPFFGSSWLIALFTQRQRRDKSWNLPKKR